MSTSFHISGVVYNVLIKPKIKQTIGETEEAYIARHKEACAKTKSGKSDIKRKLPESDTDFRERLKAITFHPESYFRDEILIDERQRVEMVTELWHTTQQYLVARRADYWLRNRANCHTYNTQCGYWDVCGAAPDEEEGLIANYLLEQEAHRELADDIALLRSIYGDRPEIMTHSRRTMFLACQKKQWFRHIRQVIPEGRSTYLSLGGNVHDCLEMWYRGVSLEVIHAHIDLLYPDRASERARNEWHYAHAMMDGYANQYPEEDWDPVALEGLWHGLIMNPKTGSPSRALVMAGREDGVVRRKSDGTYWLLEHKTASRVDHGYRMRIWEDPQIILYTHYLEQMGLDSIVEYDRIRASKFTSETATIPLDQMLSNEPF